VYIDTGALHAMCLILGLAYISFEPSKLI